MKDGWIRVYRKMLENPIVMKDAEHLAVWVWLLLNATHREHDSLFKGEKVTLHSGQLITGRIKVAQELKISESKVERILKTFESEHQIEQQKSNKNRLITVVNWDKYQTREQQNEQLLNNNRTTTEQQLNTYNNNKNDKNEKNDNNPPYPPTGEWDEDKHTNLVNFEHLVETEMNEVKNKELLNSLREWLSYKDHKKPKTNNHYQLDSIRKLANKFFEMAKLYGTETVIRLVNDTMANNYQGITWNVLEKMAQKKVTGNQSSMNEWAAKMKKERGET